MPRVAGDVRGVSVFDAPRLRRKRVPVARRAVSLDLRGRGRGAEEKRGGEGGPRSEEHTSELPSPDHLACRLLLAKKTTILTASNTTNSGITDSTYFSISF